MMRLMKGKQIMETNKEFEQLSPSQQRLLKNAARMSLYSFPSYLRDTEELKQEETKDGD